MVADSVSRLEIAGDVASLRAKVAEWRRLGETVALAPTMGALHDGHISLVAQAKKLAHRVVMSIFVNPTQFAPTEDFSAYPRMVEADAAKFAAAEGDLLFLPSAAEVYPAGFASQIITAGPAAAGLEDRFRPTHFAGVATVVAKLLNQCRPDVAVFGEKDYQQLKVVTQMARDLDFETQIFGAPTVREADGLALSSRNVYLSADERRAAPALYRALMACAAEIRAGASIEAALVAAREALASAGFAADYVEARHAETLSPISLRANGPIRLLAAARLGKTRLIDNIAV
ncbi:pantoate--beta-alanine ligase [Methylocapsa acidiphila]|uniref:pantoate--beta-alanine ligase n=1 Tax=Methylocapsa acidiphila TaxID=133552 RepID=UPI00041391F5|nr:pantoate--beta-alanine ligase [Methylocapsa acidiphila]